MRHFTVLSVATAAALALSVPTLAIAAPAPIASSVWSLSSAPQCYAIGHTVVIRGAVAEDGTHAGVPNAVVVLQFMWRVPFCGGRQRRVSAGAAEAAQVDT